MTYLRVHLLDRLNFPHKFTEKCFVIFNQSISSRFISTTIVYSYFSGNLLLSLLSRHDFKIPFKSRGGGKFSCLASFVNI